MGGMLGTNSHFVIEVGDLVKTQDSVSVTIGLLWCSQFWLLYLRVAPRGCDTYYAGLQLVLLRPRYDGQHQDWSKEGYYWRSSQAASTFPFYKLTTTNQLS